VGAIASTGWDSFTMSSLEIAACGVPLVVSALPGLDETVDEGETGFTFPAGDHETLADRLLLLLNDRPRRDEMGRAARRRVLRRFTTEQQIESLAATVRRVDADRNAAIPRTGGAAAR
jgi:glycosyltransferase involved in cell wall biosynthesis